MIGINMTACGENSPKTPENIETLEPQLESDATIPELDIPEVDYGSQTFTILATEHASYEYHAEALTGVVVSDAIFSRNMAVEERLGINLEFVYRPGHWNDRNSFNATIRSSVMANDADYDLVSGTMVCVVPIAMEGLFLNALDLENIKFLKPWWVQGQTESFAINEKLFGFLGDASLSLYKDLNVIYFNQQLIEEYHLENPYDLVMEGTWTIDKLIEMTAAVSDDLNGDGKLDLGTDRIGYYGHGVPHRGLQTALEYQIIEYDEFGMPYIASLRDQDASLFYKVLDFVKQDNVILKDMTDHQKFVIPFFSDTTLFMCEFIYATEYLRDMESDYGIIPQPKRDLLQEEYHTQVGTSTSTFFIPTTAADPELTAMACEALCYYSWKDVVPAYYEVALKVQYARDETVQNMLTIIRDSADLNFEFAFSTMFSPCINDMLPGFYNGSMTNIASHYAKYQKMWQKTLEEMLTSYDKIQ